MSIVALVESIDGAVEQQREESSPVQQELLPLFAEIAPLTNELNQFMKQRAKAGSPLSLALLRHEEQKLTKKTALMKQRLHQEWKSCEDTLLSLDADWETRSSNLLPYVRNLSTRMRFLKKWAHQLQFSALDS